ncbi:hypothetical protein LCGC14_3164930 [marine sediment metagenome]|uniref:YopX protein domain-containing protein n=1 Tax=marine sediment metagenome TaxID=412755 RepID=A0A0F8WCC6_9ZZZZ
MRKIKFRAWDKKRNEWFRHGELHLDMNGNVYLDCTKEPCNDRFDIVWFTGLHDKNGVEIYEGDITIQKLSNGLKREGVIEYGQSSFIVKGSDNSFDYLHNHYTLLQEYALEVIGNIHQDKALLETKQ